MVYMRKKSDLYKYQVKATKHIKDSYGSMSWQSVGLGKTIISMTAIEELLDSYQICGCLVVGPVKVIEAVWMQEAAIWEHTKRLTFSMVRGTPKERREALSRRADIYLINYEQLQWLTDTLKEDWIKLERLLPFDMVVFDEISKMKNATSKRCRAFVKILPYFKYRVGLTGTPATNGVIDLHGQFLMVDGGHRLGPNITGFRQRWFIQNMWSMKWEPRRNATKEIEERIADITLEMSAEDYLELPPLVTVDHTVKLSDDLMEKYREFEKELFLTLGDGDVEAFNAAAKSMKARQLASGAVYTDESRTTYSVFHDEKLDTLEELIEEMGDKPLLVCYQFIHDQKRIKERFPQVEFFNNRDIVGIVERWNKGEIKLLAGHSASMSHGLNLQHGGHHICWFGLPWSLEQYDQSIGRLQRNGQKSKTVFNHRIICEDTIETVIAEALENKGTTQRDLREAIKVYQLAKG
jgi:SNF2 family DNA or RNA helicase